MIPRTYLYVPGNRPDRFTSATGSGADAVIYDLEDSVPPGQRPGAREAVAAALDETLVPGVELWVRVNTGPAGEADLAAVASRRGLSGIVPAKTRSAADVARVVDAVGTAVLVEPLIEDARAVVAATEIASAPGVRRLHLGEGDLAADLQLLAEPLEAGLQGARQAVVLASAAAGVESPVAPASTNFRQLDDFAAECRRLAALGFWGRACIHPAQVGVVEQVFAPSPEQVAWAQGVLEALGHGGTGPGVGVDAAGRFIDEAIARRARLVLARVP